MHAPAHGAHNTVQHLLRKTLNFILLSYDSNIPELIQLNSIIIDYKI